MILHFDKVMISSKYIKKKQDDFIVIRLSNIKTSVQDL